MKDIVALLFGLYAYTISSFTQPAITFQKTKHDFGQVANLNYPPAVFKFTNSGNEPLAILMINKKPAVKVSYPSVFIAPGEENKVLVYPNLNRMGDFEEQLSVVTNASAEPVILVITGKVLSLQECFPNPDNWNIRKIIVLDKDTKAPIPASTIKMVHNMNNNMEGKTDKTGEWTGNMPIGQYHFDLAAPSYFKYQEDKFVSRSLPVLIFELEKIPPVLQHEEIIITENDPDIKEPDINFYETGDELPINLYAANNLVLLLDVSYSMKSGNKIGLLQQSIINLIKVLRSIDNVTLITYASTPNLVFKSVPGNQKQQIMKEIGLLSPGGITNGVKGLETAFSIANKQFIPSGNNQIILATDGKFTGGSQQPQEFKDMISGHSNKGIILSIIGFGVDTEAESFMADMARLGQGSYIHVSGKDDISETFINEIKTRSIK
jgi:hypothetical protein